MRVCLWLHTVLEHSTQSACALIQPQVPPALASTHHACTSVIKGDGSEFVIAAASICAKVTRDRIMRRIHAQHPLYNFEQHKGYGTAAHVAAIYKHGACPYHRMTFAPLKNMAPRTSPLKKVKPSAAASCKAGLPPPPLRTISKRALSTGTDLPKSVSRGPATSSAKSPHHTDDSERSQRLRRRTEQRSSSSSSKSGKSPR